MEHDQQKRLRRLAGIPVVLKENEDNPYVGMDFHSLKKELQNLMVAIRQAKQHNEETEELEADVALIKTMIDKSDKSITSGQTRIQAH